MNLTDLLQMNKPQAAKQSEGLGPIVQFLQMNQHQPAQQMQPITDYGKMFVEADLQNQQHNYLYAQQLEQKRAIEEEQIKQLGPHAAELTDDIQIQSMIASGNREEALLGIQLAKEQQSKRLAAQYNENATFSMYDKLVQENTPDSLAKAARIMEFKKAGGTTINVGDKFSDIGRKRLTDTQLQEAGMVPGTVAFYDKDGIPKPIDVSNTADEGKTALHAAALDSAANGYMELLSKVTDAPGMQKDSLLSDVHNMNIPGISNLALQNMSPEFQELDSRRALMIQGIEKEFSGAAGTKKEDVDYLISLVPNPHAAKSVQASTMQRFNDVVKAMRAKAGTAYTKMQQSTEGKNSYDDIINAAATKHGIDPDLIRSVIGQESAGDPNAVSNKGAAGLMQLMPGTAKDLGVTNVKDPAQNIFGGTSYLKDMLDKYGNVPEALAAYNAGPGAVDKYGGIPPYAETKTYVNNIVDKYAESKARTVGNEQKRMDASDHPTVKKIDINSPKNQERKANLEARARALGW